MSADGNIIPFFVKRYPSAPRPPDPDIKSFLHEVGDSRPADTIGDVVAYIAKNKSIGARW
jgi:hypothetical protein